MKNCYTIKKKDDWDKIPEIVINHPNAPFDADITAFCKVCYDEENLYVRLRAHEKDIRAEHTEPMGMACEDSCLEFFFSPDHSDRYFNIEMTPGKVMFLGIGHGLEDLMRLFPLRKKLYDFEPEVEYTDDGWQITYHIPFRFIRVFFPDFKAVSGSYITGNAYKTGDLCKVPHSIAWDPNGWGKGGTFHNPERFGAMYFE